MTAATVWITVDHRGGGKFACSFPRALSLFEALTEAGEVPRLLSVGDPLASLAERMAGSVTFVLADTFPPGSEGARRWAGERAFRLFAEGLGAPFVGSTCRAIRQSSSGNKIAARRLLRWAVAVPQSTVVRRGDVCHPGRLIGRLGLPLVVKRTVQTGASIGVHFADCEAALVDAVDWERRHSGYHVLVEEYVAGRELTVWIRDTGGRPAVYAVSELRRPPGVALFDHSAKVHCEARLRAGAGPAEKPELVLEPDLPADRLAAVRAAALAAHRACGLRHYSRVDLILTDGGPVVLEANAAPVLGEGLCAVAEHAGESLPAFAAHLVAEARLPSAATRPAPRRRGFPVLPGPPAGSGQPLPRRLREVR